MTKLSFIDSEARKRLGRVSKQELEDLQRVLIKLGEKHWANIRGPEPASGEVSKIPLSEHAWRKCLPRSEAIPDYVLQCKAVNTCGSF